MDLRHMPLFPQLKSDRLNLSATIRADNTIIGVIGNQRSITGVIATQIIHDDRAEEYDGTYIVMPEFYQQTLDTANKIMADDVTVKAIEVQRVSNDSGGKTIYIGGTING